MAYNIPGRTGTLIEVSTLNTLIDDLGIHSIKDAVGDWSFSKIEIEELNEKVFIYSGNDSETIDFINAGAKGVVSVASHVIGNEISDLIKLVKSGKLEDAQKEHEKLLPLFNAIFEEPSPGPIKHLLTYSWEGVGIPLLPITEISSELADKLTKVYNSIK